MRFSVLLALTAACGSFDSEAPGSADRAVNAGAPERIADGEAGARGIAVHGSDVYWVKSTNETDGAVRVKRGSAAPVDLATGLTAPNGVTFDAGFAYWSADTRGNCVDGIERKSLVDTSDAPATAVAGCTDILGRILGIASDGINVYWTNAEAHGVFSVPAAGGGGDVTLAGNEESPSGIAVNGSAVYWTSPTTGEIRAWSKIDQSVTALVTGQTQPRLVAVDDDALYWTTLAGIGEMRLNPPGPPTMIATAQSGPTALVIDSETVYWATTDGFIRRAPRHGGPVTQISDNQSVTSLAISESGLYWTLSSGALSRLPR